MAKKISKESIVKLAMLGTFLIALLVIGIVFKNDLIDKFKFNFEKPGNMRQLSKGLQNTMKLTIVGFLMGILLGLIICLIEGIKSNKTFVLIIKQIARIYVSIFRGTPMMVQLLIIYYIIFKSYAGDSLYVAMLAFGLNSGAYVSEIIRGGINSVPVGQMEAGRSLGLSYPVVMEKVIFPQAIRNCLPSLGNEFITLIKETSVAGFIGAFDLTLAFRKVANATFDYTTVYLVMGIVYFVIVFIFTKLLSLLERKLRKHAKAR